MDNNSASTEFKQLIARGKEQGYLTIEEINDLIPPDIISGDQLSVFIQTFIDMGINVCETPPDPDDILLSDSSQAAEEDVETVANQLDSTVDIGRTTDPVRMYMREMGNVSLLTRKDEIEISKRIERGTNDVQMCIVEYPLAMDELFRRYDEALAPDSEIRLGDIVVGFAEPSKEEINIDIDDSVETEEDIEKLIDEEESAEEQLEEAKEEKTVKAKKGKKAKIEEEPDSEDDEDDDSASQADSGPDPELVKQKFEQQVKFPQSAYQIATAPESLAGVKFEYKDGKRARVRLLNVNYPFHSSCLKEASTELETFARSFICSDPQIPILSNVDGSLVALFSLFLS